MYVILPVSGTRMMASGDGAERVTCDGFEYPELTVVKAFLPAEKYLDEPGAVELVHVRHRQEIRVTCCQRGAGFFS
jgi:hypothetical protein